MSDQIIEAGVLKGKDGWLFLAGGAHHVLDFISRARAIHPSTLEVFYQTIKQRENIVASLGAEYRHIIFPDKHSVLLDFFPVKDIALLGDVYVSRCADLGHTLMYPVEVLRPHQGNVFLKTDTHMSDLGNIRVAVFLAQSILGNDLAEHLDILLSKPMVQRNLLGDLGCKLEPQQSAVENFISVDWEPKTFTNNCKSNNGLIDIIISPKATTKKRLMLVGDSFGRAVCKILSYFFYQIAFLRSPHLHPELVEAMRPDYVVTENVERYLNHIQPDDLRPLFFMYPYLSEKGLDYKVPQSVAEVISATFNYSRSSYDTLEKKFLWEGSSVSI